MTNSLLYIVATIWHACISANHNTDDKTDFCAKSTTCMMARATPYLSQDTRDGARCWQIFLPIHLKSYPEPPIFSFDETAYK